MATFSIKNQTSAQARTERVVVDPLLRPALPRPRPAAIRPTCLLATLAAPAATTLPALPATPAALPAATTLPATPATLPAATTRSQGLTSLPTSALTNAPVAVRVVCLRLCCCRLRGAPLESGRECGRRLQSAPSDAHHPPDRHGEDRAEVRRLSSPGERGR